MQIIEQQEMMSNNISNRISLIEIEIQNICYIIVQVLHIPSWEEYFQKEFAWCM